jgi:hypothetical protein
MACVMVALMICRLADMGGSGCRGLYRPPSFGFAFFDILSDALLPITCLLLESHHDCFVACYKCPFCSEPIVHLAEWGQPVPRCLGQCKRRPASGAVPWVWGVIGRWPPA